MWSVHGVDPVTGELMVTPDCVDCFGLYASPLLIEAVYSVALEREGMDAAVVLRHAIEAYHRHGHQIHGM
jgi:hypothetical protein